MSEWKRKTSNCNNSASSVGKIQSWARGHINRAAGYIRQVSRDFAASFDEEEENAGRVRERREIVQSSDGHFFERLSIKEDIDLTTILPNKYIETNNSQLILDTKKSIKNCISSSKQLVERFGQFSLRPPSKDVEQQKKHINDLYLETVYTILHRIGKKSSSASVGGVIGASSDEQLLQYAKTAFQIDEKTHKALVEKALSEKPPILLLNVLLLEARDLIAKDIDGFSDPFVMLGVIPSSSPSSKGAEEQQDQPEDSPEEEQNNNSTGKPPQHRRVLQRLSGSFRRKALPAGASRREKLEAAFEQTGDGIPARIIKASSVQRKTLNPKWNEKFQFIVGDCTDRFHLDIWDHDDENRSVLDVVSSLNQVQGLKGLGRYFKEVTQSARASSGASCGGGGDGLVDDFLGSLTFSLGEIPSTGVEEWFNLEKRSEKSDVSGQIKLKMWLSTREEHRLSSTEEQRNDDFIFLDDDADGLVDVQQHKDLLRQFSHFEIGRKGDPVCTFRGELPDLALLILHQHAIQSDLTELHQLMCQWLAYIQMIGMGISFELISETFSRLISKWKPMELDKDEEYVLADSLLQFSEFCRSAILRHRLRIRVRSGSRRRSPSPKRSELESFGEMLKCYRLVRESSVFAHLVPYQTHFRTEMRELLEKSAHLHFNAILLNIEEITKNNKNYNCGAINRLYLLIHSLNTTLERSSKFEELFKQEMSEIVKYADISYCTFDLLLHEHIISEMMSEDCSDLRAITQLCHHEENQHNNNIDDEKQILLPILQVHLALNEFAGYRHILMTGTTGHFQYRMEQLDWSAHFDRAIQRWLEFAQVHAFSRLDLSLNLDCQSPIILLNNDIRQTVSAMDACHILEQLIFIWERLRVENMQLRASLTIRLIRLLCKISKHFTDQIIMRRSFDFGNLNKQNISEQITIEQIDHFTALINSCEQVRRSLTCADRLKLDEIDGDGFYVNENSTIRNQIEQQLDNCSQNIVEQIESLIDQFVFRQIAKYKKTIFHLVWSPSACPTDDCLKPLIKLLDGELSLVHRCLLHRNFTRVMYSQVHLLLKLFQECVNENIGQEPIFYRRLTDALAILLDFFHADGKGIAVESFAQSADYRHFHEQISLFQMSTENLIELYYRELIKAQQEVTECKYGILNLRAYFNANSQILVIEILSAKQIIPLDSNGLSDPYVVIELLPKVHFTETSNAKTKVVNSCLNPIFGETFEFNVPSILPQCALVHFVIMDHDFLKSNDFAGEAFLDLREVPGFAIDKISSGGQQPTNRSENQHLNRNRQAKANNASTTNNPPLRTGNTLPLQFNLVLTHPSTRATNPTILAVLSSRKEDREAEEFIRSLSATY